MGQRLLQPVFHILRRGVELQVVYPAGDGVSAAEADPLNKQEHGRARRAGETRQASHLLRVHPPAPAAGHSTLVRILLSLGVDANRLTSSGETPLHCAAKEGHLPKRRGIPRTRL